MRTLGSHAGAPKQQMKMPLILNAHVRTKYFEVGVRLPRGSALTCSPQEKPKYSMGSFLSNPMSFMMIMTLGIIVVFPQMIKNMDPEAMKEMQEQMNQNDPNKMLSDMFKWVFLSLWPLVAFTSCFTVLFREVLTN